MKLNYNKAEFTAAYGKFSQLPPPQRIEIAFAGHSNVGKSTLINKLFNRKKLARVSSVPGKQQQSISTDLRISILWTFRDTVTQR